MNFQGEHNKMLHLRGSVPFVLSRLAQVKKKKRQKCLNAAINLDGLSMSRADPIMKQYIRILLLKIISVQTNSVMKEF